ncbi:MAG: DNA directed RNA polymerase subunit L [Edafosvirus sp.]|uniref:DNA directed RNA polymerase subunit L n=1 Tax=Edafosvirus sp. TaxID=2487765 RepID=A0A3G4ZV41_9VIRU|nr:MAG: DNA directed RNA polymerase subunit L [Edafosvirus sp.]
MNSKNIDLTITQLEKKEFKDLISSKLVIQLTGKDANVVMANTLRRTSFDDIATYAFCNESINIEYNDTIFNSDYMRLRLSQIPIFNIENDVYFLPLKYWKKINYADPKREKHPDEKVIQMYISSHNDTTEIMNVTTNHIKFYQDTMEIPNKYDSKYPILLVQLRPNETFKCQMKAVLGVGERNNIWAASSTAFYDELETNKINFTIESQGQMDEYEILVKACKIIQLKLETLKSDIQKKLTEGQIKPSQDIEIDFDGEDHTMGSLITYSLQDHPNITYAGVSKPDHLIKQIKIKMISTDDTTSALDPFFEVLDHLKQIYGILENKIYQLGKKHIKLKEVEQITVTPKKKINKKTSKKTKG